MLRAALLALPAVLLASPSLAEELTLYLANRAPHAVAAELSAPGGDGEWPGGGKVYLLEKGERKSVRIECRVGETICYGAWRFGDETTAYGVGPERDLVCDQCCLTCAPVSAAHIDIGG
ncbi:hypothetical protein ABGN05_18735 [Aquibium sp. LZ166]|uniref:Uncharacterized protein n=1 Tax=Aquibium pacificus TaxID=3153579 RepID=A0ABV3SLN2_9HYPH